MPRAALDQQTLTELVGLVYEAAGDSASWPAFLERFSDVTGGTLTTLHGQDLGSNEGRIGASVRFDPAFQKAYEEHYSKLNVFMLGRKELFRPGAVVTGQMLVDDETVAASEYHCDWLRPQDVFHLVGGFVLQEGSWTCALSSMRPRARGPFGRTDVRLLEALMPHLTRAVQLHRRLEAAASLHASSLAALDQLPLGVVLVEATGRVALANRRAHDLLHEGDGLRASAEGLRAADSRDDAQLQQLIKDACDTALGTGLRAGGSLSLRRPSLKRPLAVLVAPAPGGRSFWSRGVAAVVFVSDPERGIETVPETLARFYGLTPAEARLTALVTAGTSLKAAADDLQISRETARNQIKRVFAKTGTRGQADLVRLVMSGPAVVERPRSRGGAR